MSMKNAPEVSYNREKKQWALHHGENEVLFDALVMAIAFGDPLRLDYELPAIAVVGRQTDNIMVVCYVFMGSWAAVKLHSIDVKDRFCIRRVYLPETPERFVTQLMQLEGLTWYDYRPVDGSMTNQKEYVTPTETWPEFRNHDLRANLCFVDPDIEKEIATSAVKLDELMKAEKIMDWPGSGAQSIMMMTGEVLKESLYDARLRAILYAMEAVLPRERRGHRKSSEPKPWYT